MTSTTRDHSPMTLPTSRQLSILAFIERHHARHGHSPTLRDIGKRFGFGLRAAQDHVDALRAKGLLECTTGRTRTMLVTYLGHRALGIKHTPKLVHVIPERRCQVCRCAVFTEEGCPMCAMRGAA